jgi:urate oxidase
MSDEGRRRLQAPRRRAGRESVVLSQAQYGKAEVRLLHVDRHDERHEITDLNVTITLAGDLPETYLTGDNSKVLTTDEQKITVYALARKFGVRPVEAFAATHSLSLQQTLYAMGEAVLAARPEVCEVRLSLPNKHHFLVDLGPFGLDNPGEVFFVADRPYGLIEGAVQRTGAPAGDTEHRW